MPNDASETIKFIDVLLVIMSLVLAGGLSSETDSSWQGAIFYFGLFTFLVTAVALRALMTISKSNNSFLSIFPRKLYSFIISISFPSVLAVYFYIKLKPYAGNSLVFNYGFVAVDLIMSLYIVMALYKTLEEDNV